LLNICKEIQNYENLLVEKKETKYSNSFNNVEKHKSLLHQLIFYKSTSTSFAKKMEPILEELIKRLIKSNSSEMNSLGTSELIKIEIRDLFGYLPQNEWANLNIGYIMQISPLTLNDLFSVNPLSLELLRESLIDSISLVVCSYFSISTEKRFLAEEKVYTNLTFKKSEFFHAKSLEITCLFLPSESPLYSHILMSYQKHHSPMNQAIVKIISLKNLN